MIWLDDWKAGKNPPTTNPMPRITGNDSRPSHDNNGIAAMRTARVRSEPSISRRGPTAVATRAPTRPSTVRPTNSAASTTPIRAGEPVVTRTNQGNAIAVISVPAVEMTSAAISPATGRRIDGAGGLPTTGSLAPGRDDRYAITRRGEVSAGRLRSPGRRVGRGRGPRVWP